MKIDINIGAAIELLILVEEQIKEDKLFCKVNGLSYEESSTDLPEVLQALEDGLEAE